MLDRRTTSTHGTFHTLTRRPRKTLITRCRKNGFRVRFAVSMEITMREFDLEYSCVPGDGRVRVTVDDDVDEQDVMEWLLDGAPISYLTVPENLKWFVKVEPK